MNDNLVAGDNADPGNLAGAGRLAVIGHICRKRREFQERRSGIKQCRQPVAQKHFALPA